MNDLPRPDGRAGNALRPISFEPGIAPHATGSVIVSFGDTRVICAATLEKSVPRWMQAQKVVGGWLSAEYSMLPYSTLDRKQRDINRGKQDGRAVEIQRLIGRSLRAVVDLSKLPGMTLWFDCDVLQADGGTRTAAITGAWVALHQALDGLVRSKALPRIPLTGQVAAVSCGVYGGVPVLDLDYVEDSSAHVDTNFVLTAEGHFVEIQGTAEEEPFSQEQFDAMLALARKGIGELAVFQRQALGIDGRNEG